MWYIYIMEYNSAFKQNEMNEGRKSHPEWGNSDPPKRQRHYVFTYLWMLADKSSIDGWIPIFHFLTLSGFKLFYCHFQNKFKNFLKFENGINIGN